MAICWQSILCACFVSAALIAGTAVAAGEVEDGFIDLTGSDGREQWLGYGLDEADDTWPASWEFSDGVLHAKGAGVDLKTKEEYGDFDLRFDWKISPKGNSGVMYGVSQETDPPYFTGPEYQVIDDVGNGDAVSPDTSSASCYALYAPTKQLSKPAGEWNEGRIVRKDNHVEHYLNGEKVTEYDLGSDDWNKRVAASKFNEWKKFGTNARGHIDLQDHGNEVWYRNVRIKSLDAAQGN